MKHTVQLSKQIGSTKQYYSEKRITIWPVLAGYSQTFVFSSGIEVVAIDVFMDV